MGWENEELPEFSLDGEKYDQSIYSGRFRKMVELIDPRQLFHSQSEIEAAGKILHDWKAGDRSVSNEDLWSAKRLYYSAVNRDSEEIIPQPFRMAGYIPYNAPLCIMALLAQRTPTVVLAHFLNQSQNALVNYYNRNASNPTSTEQLMKSYGISVSTAVGIAWGMKSGIERMLPKRHHAVGMRWIALFASSGAAACNCYFMRKPELSLGIALTDHEDNEVGKSRVAAERAMKEMIISRIALVPPVFGVPAAIMSMKPVLKLAERNKTAGIAISTASLLLGFAIGLPASIAAFPQIGSIESTVLEKHFHDLVDKNTGQPIRTFYFNKGL